VYKCNWFGLTCAVSKIVYFFYPFITYKNGTVKILTMQYCDISALTFWVGAAGKAPDLSTPHAAILTVSLIVPRFALGK